MTNLLGTTMFSSREGAPGTLVNVLAVFFVAFGLSACATNDPSGSMQAGVPVERSISPYKMAPLDTAAVSVGGETTTLQISQGGTIDLKGETRRVEGMPVEEFRALLVRSYGGGAKVDIVEFRPNRITVLGEVFHQIHVQLDAGPMRVMDAIAAANGFTPLANKRRVKLLRENAGDIEVYELDLREMMMGRDMNQNMLLKAGDIITVPRNFL
jgi:protein involved in polysaccharide export with SLBB domain